MHPFYALSFPVTKYSIDCYLHVYHNFEVLRRVIFMNVII